MDEEIFGRVGLPCVSGQAYMFGGCTVCVGYLHRGGIEYICLGLGGGSVCLGYMDVSSDWCF